MGFDSDIGDAGVIMCDFARGFGSDGIRITKRRGSLVLTFFSIQVLGKVS